CQNVARRERLAWVVDLEVTEPEIGERAERLLSRPLDVAVAHVGPLRALRGRNTSLVVEQVSRVRRDRAAGYPAMERGRRNGGDDPSEVGHVGARRGASERHGLHRGLDDAAALGGQVREGWSRVPADDGRGLPCRIVEAGMVPTQGPTAAVE